MTSTQKARQEWLLKNGPCKMCGSKNGLQVDHRRPQDKKYDPFLLPVVARRKELRKCQVICARCHRQKTFLDGLYGRCHGILRYQQGCRCQRCKTAAKTADGVTKNITVHLSWNVWAHAIDYGLVRRYSMSAVVESALCEKFKIKPRALNREEAMKQWREKHKDDDEKRRKALAKAMAFAKRNGRWPDARDYKTK